MSYFIEDPETGLIRPVTRDIIQAVAEREGRKPFIEGLVKIVFPYIMNTPGLLEAGLDDAIKNPNAHSVDSIWMQTDMLVPEAEIVDGLHPLLVMQQIGRIASPQAFSYYFNHMSQNDPETYDVFASVSIPVAMELFNLHNPDQVTPDHVAEGIAQGNTFFYGAHLPWIILAGLYEKGIGMQTHVYTHSGDKWNMAWRMATDLTNTGFGYGSDVQERLSAVFGPTEAGGISYAVKVMQELGSFKGTFTCPAEGFVDRSFRHVSQYILTSEFRETTTPDPNADLFIIPNWEA